MGILCFIKRSLNFSDNTVIEKEEESTVYDELKYVEKMCEKSIQISNTKAKKINELNHVNETLNSIKIFENMDNKALKNIEGLMDEYYKLKKSRENLREHIVENGKKYEHLAHFSHKEFEDELEEITSLEEEQKVLKKDLEHLRGEKQDILYNIEKIEKTSSFIRILFHITLFIISLSLVSLILLATVLDQDILIPGSISTVVLVFWICWIFIFNSKLSSELIKYKKLQAKEVQLSNKIKVDYVDITSKLDAKYRKYNTKSSEDLKKDWDNYQETLDKKYEYNKIFHKFFDIEENLQKILTSKGMVFAQDINMLEIISDFKEKLKLKEDLENKIEFLEKEIQVLDNEQEKINKILKELESDDKTDKKIIKSIIDSYFKQIKKIV